MLCLSIHTALQEDTLVRDGDDGGGGRGGPSMTCKYNLVLVYVVLTYRESCGSSCGRSSYLDYLVHAGEPVVLEGRLESDITYDVFTPCRHCSAYQKEWVCLRLSANK